MKLRVFLIINAILAIVHGIGFILMPSELLALYQVSRGASEQLMGQFFGATLLSVGVLAWLGKDLTDSRALAAIVLANLIGVAVGAVVSIRGVLSGVMGSAGWTSVAIYVFLTLGFLYFQFKRDSYGK